LAVIKQAAQNFKVEIFNLWKLSVLGISKQYHIRFQTRLRVWRT